MSYVKYIDKAYFAGLLPIILLIVFVLVAVYIISKFVIIHISVFNDENKVRCTAKVERRDIDGEYTGIISADMLLFAAVIIADAILAFVGVQGSELVSARYIYSALPIFAVFIVWCMSKLLPVIVPKHSNIVIGIVCVILCAGSIKVNGIDWQYETYADQKAAVEEMAGKDCVIICHGDDMWNNIYAGVNAFSVMGRCRYVYEKDIKNNIVEVTKDCGNELYMAVINDPKFDMNDIRKDFKYINKATKFKRVEKTYSYGGVKIYRMTVK